MEMNNNFRREQNMIRELQGDLEWEKDRKKTMVYRKDETDRDIGRHPERHAKTMEKVRREHEERVNGAIIYAAELTKRVECMDRVEERQKEQLEKIKEAGDVIFAENEALEQKIASLKMELRKTSSRKRPHVDN